MTEPPRPVEPAPELAEASERRGDSDLTDEALEPRSNPDASTNPDAPSNAHEPSNPHGGATPPNTAPPPPGLTPESKIREEPSAPWEFVGAAVVMLVVIGAIGGSKLVRLFETRPTADQCKMLVERWLSHASRQQDPDVTDREVTEAQERARVAGEYVGDVGRCQRDLTASEVQCGIDSSYLDALERCLQ